MIESEEHSFSIAEQKARIRERYKGIDTTELDVIPALPQENFYEDTKEKRVAVYARVSTDDPRQTSSYELQKNHYLDVVGHHEGWKLVDIYADEGISGTSLQHRDSFVRMINDCNIGKIDLIVTKSVSRFARNVLDCIGYVRKLAAMQPPIGVFFETENIFTLNSNSEMSLSFISTLAQEESHNKSEIMNASVEMRFRRGIFLTPPLLGYDIDEDGNLVINPEEAKTVRLIFFMYLYGYTCTQIADTLTKLGRQTKKGNTVWSSGSVIQILQNERHCGDVLARKTWTPSYLNHKSKKNRQDRNQYRQKNHHEAIVSRDDFIAVQRMLNQPTYEKMIQMRMSAMADAYRQQTEDPSAPTLSFEKRMGLLVDAEYWSRHNNRLKRNIHKAALDQPQASLTDINYTAGRLLDKKLIQALDIGTYIQERHNIIILGATGSGKTILLAPSAWRPASRASPFAMRGCWNCWRSWPLPEAKAAPKKQLPS